MPTESPKDLFKYTVLTFQFRFFYLRHFIVSMIAVFKNQFFCEFVQKKPCLVVLSVDVGGTHQL